MFRQKIFHPPDYSKPPPIFIDSRVTACCNSGVQIGLGWRGLECSEGGSVPSMVMRPSGCKLMGAVPSSVNRVDI